MADLSSGVARGDIFLVPFLDPPALSGLGVPRPTRPETGMGLHGCRGRGLGMGDFGAHSAPLNPKQKRTVCLVLFSAPPRTHPGSRRPAPHALSLLRVPPHIPVVPQPGQGRDAGCTQTGTRRERRGQGAAREGASRRSSASSPFVALQKRRGLLLRCTTNKWWGKATPSEPVVSCEMEEFRKSNWKTAHFERKQGFTAGGIHSFRFLGFS